jgi:myo-inositol 2-dehydrogenase / D-chiro-inositol 1-dehydrogenase
MEITGVEGKVSINTHPGVNHVSIYEKSGIRREIPPDYNGRFRDAFIAAANEFTTCCLNGAELPTKLELGGLRLRLGARC